MKIKRLLAGFQFLAVAALPAARAQAALSTSPAYEVEGKIELCLLRQDGQTVRDYQGEFRIYVNGCGWLIQTIETNDFGIPLRREIGTTNGIELFELVAPYEPLSDDAQAGAATKPWGPPAVGTIQPSGEASTNPVPVGRLDSSFVGHLWLMFASGCYLESATGSRLPPVYEYRGSPLFEVFSSAREDWQLLDGPGSLPSKVVYHASDGSEAAVYTVTQRTNAGAVVLPARFHFEQPARRYKVVDVEVTVVRAGCSRTNLLPVLKGKIDLIDYRWQPTVSPGDFSAGLVAFQTDHWPSVEESRQIYAKLNPAPPPQPPIVRPEVQLPERSLEKLAVANQQKPAPPFRDAVVDPAIAAGLPDQGPWTISTNDFGVPFFFTMNLADHDKEARERRNFTYTFLWNRLRPETQAGLEKELAEMHGPGISHIYHPGPELDALMQNLNDLINGGSIYDGQGFQNVRLSGDTLKLMAAKPTGAQLARLNRLLLEDLLPMDLIRRPKIIADPASNLRAFVDFQRIGISPAVKAVVTLYAGDGSKLWTTDVAPQAPLPGGSPGMGGIRDAGFAQTGLFVSILPRHSFSIELKTGNVSRLPNL